LKKFLLAFIDEIFVHTLRGSLLVGGVVLLLSNTGAWQYFASSMLAHDIKRAAHWSQSDSSNPRVVVVAIDDAGYQNYFSAKSPIDRDRVKQLLQTVSVHAPNAKRIVLDLDLSPVPGQMAEQKELDDFFLTAPKRWVLAAVNSGSEKDRVDQKTWRAQLCQKGISFGLPYLPNEFGYPRLTHQYHNGLADMAVQAAGRCAEPSDTFKQKVMPLSPTMLQTGLVIPFNGNLKALGDMLDTVEPDWVVVGGAWGSTDIFATPFGDRFGVQVHAAALAGSMEQQRVAPHLLQLMVAWIFVSLASVLLGYMTVSLGRLFTPVSDEMAGHRFFTKSILPLVFTLSVLGMLFALSEVLSALHARTGYWIPSSVVGCTALATMILVWNWGKGATHAHLSLKEGWTKVVSLPIKQDMQSVAMAFQVVRHGPQPQAWGVEPSHAPISRKRAAFEGVFALLSLIMQTIAPLGSVLYAAFKSL